MDIKQVVEKLNKQLGTNIKTDYYTHIEEWRQWWAGNVKAFHIFNETTDTGRKKERKLYTMKMAKKVCEDWASFLLNEKTKISLEDDVSSEFLQGKEEDYGTGGVFGGVNFWTEANALVEKAFYSGTGAFVMKLDELPVSETGTVLKSDKTRIRLEYLPAMCILPLTVKYGKIKEVAFVSETMERGNSYVYAETHTLENELYVIRNQYYKTTDGALTEAPLPDGVAGQINTGSPNPFFAIIKPNIVNVYDNSMGLGCSVYANAVDNLKGVDIAFNNFVRDSWLGGKKVFYNQKLTKTEIDEDGNRIQLTPDDVLQQLFVPVGDELIDDKKLIQEFNPALRVEDNREAVQAQLDYLSFKCGMGAKHYQFHAPAQAMTATQYVGDKQELKQYAAKHGIIVERALQEIVRAILWAGKNIMGESVDPETAITVEFPDGYIVSDEEKRKQDKEDVQDGLMMKWEYRMKWYNETEEDARKAIEENAQTFGGFKYPPGEGEE